MRLAVALCWGGSALAGSGDGPISCAEGGEALCEAQPGFVCRELSNLGPGQGGGFECFGQSGQCPTDPEGAHVPEHATMLFSNPGRPAQEQRTYSFSIVNGTVSQLNSPQAQVVCEPGYQGIPQGGQWEVRLTCSCNVGPFGRECRWQNFNEALAAVVEVARPRSETVQAWSRCRKLGCMDSAAFNYDLEAQVDDGSCTAKMIGCMNASASNYMPYFNVNDPSTCIYGDEIDRDECNSSPCTHGSCRDLFHAWRCICNDGWSGERCDSQHASPPPPGSQCPVGKWFGHGKCNPCTVCQNGKAEHTPCTTTSDTHCVDCPSGRFNDGSWDEGGCHDCTSCCDGWRPQYGGSCRPDRNTQCVECPHGQYVGTSGQCHDCDSCANAQQVCVHSAHATCRATEASAATCDVDSLCQHGGETQGTCGFSLFGKFLECQCSCPSGWVGKHCEQESPCKDNPCSNGGVCQERDSAHVPAGELAYACQCLPGYSGSNCQVQSSVCGACCNGVKNCTNGTSPVCTDEAPARQCGISHTGLHCEPPCENGGKCVDVGFEGWTACHCIFPWLGDSCTKLNNYSSVADESPAMIQEIRDRTGINSSSEVLYILTSILAVSSCGALFACFLAFRRRRDKILEARQEIEMRMVPQGPTGLGHLQRGVGSIRDLSQIPEYKPEPGFEEFDYNPHVEGAGDDYFAALSGKGQGSGRKKELFSGRFGHRRSQRSISSKESLQKGSGDLTESLVR